MLPGLTRAPSSDFRGIREQEAPLCVRLCVVWCWPVLIGPGKAGNYTSLVRNVSGLSLAFQTQGSSEALHFQPVCGIYKSTPNLLLG